MYNISIVCHIKCHTGPTLTYSHPVVLPISLSVPTLPLSKAGDASGIFPHWAHGTALLVPSVRGVLIQKWQASGLRDRHGVAFHVRGFSHPEGIWRSISEGSDKFRYASSNYFSNNIVFTPNNEEGFNWKLTKQNKYPARKQEGQVREGAPECSKMLHYASIKQSYALGFS